MRGAWQFGHSHVVPSRDDVSSSTGCHGLKKRSFSAERYPILRLFKGLLRMVVYALAGTCRSAVADFDVPKPDVVTMVLQDDMSGTSSCEIFDVTIFAQGKERIEFSAPDLVTKDKVSI